MVGLLSIDFSGLSKVANKLIDKISSAIGWVVTHETPNRVAIRNYIEEIEQSNLPALQKAATISRAKKDIREYANQCSIVNGALSFLQDTAKPEQLEDDWIAQFFDKTRLVSDDDFQAIWSKILADECNEPGSVPKSLLFILERMNKEDAEDFLKLCGVTISVFDESAPLMLDLKPDELSSLGLDFDRLVHIESMGLIKLSSSVLGPTYAVAKDENCGDNTVSYFDNKYELPEDMNSFTVGSVIFTKDGYALYKAASATEIAEFWDNTVIPWIETEIENHKKEILK